MISYTHPILHLHQSSLPSFTWNLLIKQSTKLPFLHDFSSYSPLSIFRRMRLHVISPDFHTFPFLLHSFSSPSHLSAGRIIHAQLFSFGFSTDPFVQTSLINMYSSCGHLGFAKQVFDEIVAPDLPSWNSIIHASVKVGLVDLARKLFDDMPQRNVISWCSMINGYVNCGQYRDALAMFRDMQCSESGRIRTMPNEFTLSCVLSACGRLGALEQGKWVHAYIDRSRIQIDVVLGTSLIDMYSKCGSIERARMVFEGMGSNKDVKAWSAMISGLAMHGHSKECLELFYKMTCVDRLMPNAVTFLSVLCACVHGGMVKEGKHYFRMMIEEFEISPLIQHYGCMVDLYGRAGLIKDALGVISSMPVEPDVLVWGALLSGSRMKGDIETCEVALRKIVELEPTNSGAYVLLSNVYAKLGRWTDVKRVRTLMEEKGIKKVPGCSLVELDGIVHEFFVGDETHPERQGIYLMLEEIMRRLKLKGYVGDTREVLLDLDEEGKEVALSSHSEKLALAFGLLKTSSGAPIRIIKNLRICRDCHIFVKMVSQLFGREVIVRDCNRFHHFANGFCSCKDYW